MSEAGSYTVRPATAADAGAILSVHTDAIHVLCAGDYSPAQLAGWSQWPGYENWLQRKLFAGEIVLVAESATAAVVGFAERTDDEIRAVYVHPLHARRGVGSALLRQLEQSARAEGVTRLWLDSSLTAEPFYRARGYETESVGQHTCSNGTVLQCVRMAKRLS